MSSREPRPQTQVPLNEALHRALALQRAGRYRDAAPIYEAVLQKAPGCFDALHNLGLVRLQLGDVAGAIALMRGAIARNPGSAEAHNNLGGALQALNHQEESIAPYRRAIALAPAFADPHNNLGAALKALGRIDDAIAAFEAAIALAPDRPAFYRNLVDTKTIVSGDPILGILDDFARHGDRFPRSGRIQLHFACAKALSDVGDHGRAFNHLRAGNVLKREDIVYDERNTLALFDRIRRRFPAERLSRPSRGGSERPVFVVGMPRSGTTLVEQILAGHSRVHAAGELTDLDDLVGGLATAHAPFPDCMADVDDARLGRLGDAYLARLAATAPDCDRVIDKMPANAGYLGLIRLALPGARIIRVRRDPVDTCLSCFSILFTGHQPFTYDLGELGRYHAAHDRLMAHWRDVLPPETLLEVGYEDIVADPDREARRMIGHLGLAWEESCLRFHENRGPVRTASAVQVRRPLYSSSIGRWRPDGADFAQLLQALRA